MEQLQQLWSTVVSVVVVDALIVSVIFGGVMLYAYTIGSQRILSAYFAIAAAGLLVFALPSVGELSFLAGFKDYEQNLLLFGVSFLLWLLVLWRNRFFDPYIVPSGIEKLFFSLGLAGWLIVVLGFIVPPSVLGLSASVQIYFFSPIASICWLVAPILLFALFRGKT